jgi:hypothetical protein
MRGLIWVLGCVIVAMGMYCASSPRWMEVAPDAVRPIVKIEPRSLVVRLAEAGQARRQREAATAGAVVLQETAIFFDAK